MKQFVNLFIVLCCFSCKKSDNACTEVTFGESIELADEESICIDNVEYTFKANDERCCCGCVCAWAGEFVLSFEDSDGTVVYTYRESQSSVNDDIPFGESMEIVSIEAQGTDCGDDAKIDEVRFTILIN